jgi:sarcosine oxidase subunit beta
MVEMRIDLPKTADIVIIGGGVMGASTAYHLAARGVHNIVLLEKEEYFGTGATGRCAGGVRYQFATEVNIRLSIASLPMLERFEDEIGQVIDYRKCGYLFVLSREQDIPVFKNNLKLQNHLGVSTEWLDDHTVRHMLPMMQLDDVIGATFNPQDGLVDPNSVVMGYVNAAQRSGASAINQCPVIGFDLKDNKVIAVDTPHGKIATGLVVDATGPWAAQTASKAGIQIPVTPLRRQWLTTTPIPELPGDFPFVIDFAQSLYFHKEGPGILTGMSNPDEQPGYDQGIDLQWELIHLDAAIARLPWLEKCGLVSRMAGLYETTPDSHPIFGRTPIQGYYVVTGFSGHGFMHGPISGKLMSEIILDGQSATVDVSMLDLARFEEGRLIPEYNVV